MSKASDLSPIDQFAALGDDRAIVFEANMPKQRNRRLVAMFDRIARALAKADGATFAADPARYRLLAIAALKPLTVPPRP